MAHVFSKLNMKSAYFQIQLHEDSRDLTCFVTPDGLFHFRRVPFGLVSASGAFARMMDEVLKGPPGVHHYFDDIEVSR